VALDPRDIVTDLADRSPDRPPAVLRPPAMLRRPVSSASPPAPVRESPEVAAMHDGWARLHAGTAALDPAASGLRSRMDAVAVAVGRRLHHDERTLIGTVIQAVDAVARRCDELANRVSELEQQLGEVVDVLGADLTRVRAALGVPVDAASEDADAMTSGAGSTSAREPSQRDG
jgi:hypothetical protein